MAETYNGRHVPDDVLTALRRGSIVDAIRFWRDFTGDSLLASKIFIEAIRPDVLNRKGSIDEPASKPVDPATLPKEQLLLKLLKMTTVQEDTVALVAIRKANELLASAGWDWDKLISGKIKIVENPFKNIPNPATPRTVVEPTAARTTAWSQTLKRAPKPTLTPGVGHKWEYEAWTDSWQSVPDPAYKQPTRQYTPQRGYGLTRGNNYANHCYCCGLYVGVQNGFIFKPYDLKPSVGCTTVTDRWQTMCDDCNKTGNFIGSRPAMKQTGQTTTPAPNLGNL